MTKFLKTAAVAAALAVVAGGASALTQLDEATGSGGFTYYVPEDGIIVDGELDMVLRGSNGGTPGETKLTITAGADERVTFDMGWTYLNIWEAIAGRGTDQDPFFLDLNGTVTQLSVDNEAAKFGDLSFTLNPGEYVSFILRSLDGANNAATVALQGEIRISAVPVPAAGLMLMAGLGGLAMLRRRGDKAAA